MIMQGGELESLVSQVKDLQRSDHGAKDQWHYYCFTEGGGVKDPAKHQPEFLQKFLDAYKGGVRLTGESEDGAASGEPTELALCIKSAQQKSKAWSNAWKGYCAVYGRGVNDPLKHHHMYLSGFLDYLGQQAQMSLTMDILSQMGGGGGGAGGWQDGGYGAPPAKRFKGAGPNLASGFSGAFAGGCKGGGFGGKGAAFGKGASDPAKDALVQRIKNYQRGGEQFKEFWWAHCDTLLGGVRDPARHATDVLQQFVDSHQVP
eukprot:TRINITY_DN73620_c0_g1_i1.p1 TRINITY_DN73620_c0_g1~~TRINITY_DN73620_c0_g1_i1.p1  ORF type:complete len:260 (-),score=50.32 TRINITY_DN73620_c0_g1_i1:15-794(-)